MYKLVVSAVLSLTIIAITAEAQSNLTAKVTNIAANSSTPNTETDRGRDGFTGPVRRVRTEVAKLSNAAGKIEEGKKAVLETAEYDVNGVKTQICTFQFRTRRSPVARFTSMTTKGTSAR